MKPKNPVRSVERTFDIVDCLSEKGSATVSELSEAVDMPISTVHNHLKTLESREFVVQHGKEYELSFRFLELGGRSRRKMALYREGRPEIDKLAEESQEVANLMVEEHGLGVHIYSAKSDQGIIASSFTGKRVPLHTTAMGKSILSRLPEERVNEIVSQKGLDQSTDNTITDREALHDDLERIRERGFSRDLEEKVQGLRCVAAPILANDEIVGAVSVSGPASRMNGEKLDETVPELVQNTADLIGVKITYT